MMSYSSNQQTTCLNLNLTDLQYPHLLIIKKVDRLNQGKIKGKIKIAEKTIQEINSEITEINLSAWLQRGKNAIDISAIYTPVDACWQITFQGVNTYINQQISGSGTLNQKLIIIIN